MNLREALIQLYNWQYKGSTSFSAEFFKLYAKADMVNKAKLDLGFPEYSEAYQTWFNAPDQCKEIFKELGILDDSFEEL